MILPVVFEHGERACACNALAGDYGIEPIIGRVVLEQMDLQVDCGRMTLHVNPNSPASPLF